MYSSMTDPVLGYNSSNSSRYIRRTNRVGPLAPIILTQLPERRLVVNSE